MKIVVGMALGCFALSAPASLAQADTGGARCTVKVISALPGQGGIDPAITSLRARLQEPPFNSWHSFKLLSRKEEELKLGASASYPLPNGNHAVVTYREHKSGGGKHVVRGVFHVDHAKATSETSFALDEGAFFLVAGEKWNGGILIYSLSCQTED